MGQKTNSTIFSLSLKNAEWKSKYLEKNLEESSLLLYKDVEIRNYLNQVFELHGLVIHNCKIEYSQSTTNFLITFFEKRTETMKFYEQTRQSNKSLSKIITVANSKELVNHLVNNVLMIDLNMFCKSTTINFKTQNLNQKFEALVNESKANTFEYRAILHQFKRFLKTPLFKELIKVLFISVSEKDSAKLLAEAISYYFEKQKKRHGFVLFLLKRALEELIPSSFSQVKGVKIVIAGRFNGVPRSSKKILKVGKVPLQSFNSSISYHEDTSYTANGTFGVKVWICQKD
jgi:ribosomal protein S3